MKFLLDTHSFLWWVGNDHRLSSAARDGIASSENEVYFSVVSAWEMAIKIKLGRLSLERGLERFLKTHLSRNAFSILPVGLNHAIQLDTLPLHHRDPFDRMLIAQAQSEKMRFITNDLYVNRYDVAVFW